MIDLLRCLILRISIVIILQEGYIILFIIVAMKLKMEKEEGRSLPHDRLRDLLKIRKEQLQIIHKLQKKRSLLMIDTHNNTLPEISEGEPQKKVKFDQGQEKVPQDFQNKVNFKNQQDKLKLTHKESRQRNKKIDTQSQKPELNKIKNQFKQRNRRMFGGLNSYLKKAKSTLEAQKPKADEKNRILEHVKQKQKQQNQSFLKQELYKLEAQLKQHQDIRQKNAKQILQLQKTLLLGNYSKYTNNLKTFIFTKTEPVIAWLPAKELDIAKKLLGEKQKQIQVQSEKIIESIKNYEEKFDYNLYLLDNENQYYTNLATKYHQANAQYYITQTQPKILWKTNTEMHNHAQLQQNSKNFIEKQITATKQKADQFYSSIKSKLNTRTIKSTNSFSNPKKVETRKKEEEDSESNSPFNFIKMDESD